MSLYTIDIEYTQNNITKIRKASFTREALAIQMAFGIADNDVRAREKHERVTNGKINKIQHKYYAKILDFDLNAPIYFKINWP